MPALSQIARAALARARAAPAPAKPRKRLWTQAEQQALTQLYPATPMPELTKRFQRDDRAIYSKARDMGLARSPEYLASEHACRLRRGGNIGAEFRFQKGHATWNAGMKGWQAEGCQATQFKKGNKPHTWVPIGTEQIRDGYLWRKVTDHGGRHDWRQAHVLLWEQHHGPIPAGLILVFSDRNRANIQLDNLELITRAENCRRNTIHRYPPELKSAIRKLARLKRTIEDQS